ncbi:helix-turn-helix domain-containing protein [Intestinibacter sp.]
MKIEMSILYNFLNKKYNIKSNIKEFNENKIDGYLFFKEKEDLELNYVYIINSNQIKCISNQIKCINDSTVNTNNFICIGDVSQSYKNKLSNIIYILDNIDIFELFNYLQIVFNKLNSWNDKITKIIYSSMDVSKIFEVTSDILPLPLLLIDKDLFYISKSDDIFKEDKTVASLDNINKMLLEEDFKESFSKKEAFYYKLENERFICFNIYQNKTYKARLIASISNFDFKKGDYILFEHLGKRIEEMYQNNFNILKNNANDNELHRLLKSLLLNELKYNHFNIDYILGKYNWKKDDNYQVIKIDKLITNTISISSVYFCTYLEQHYEGTCAVEFESSIVWIINYNKMSQELINNFRRELSIILRENLCKAGTSNCFNDINFLSIYFKQAKYAFLIGNMVDNTLWCYNFEDYKLKYLMDQCTKEFDIQQIVPQKLLDLKKYDIDNDTKLCETLYVYIQNRFNASKTAQDLYIHRSTLLFRINRIYEITKFDLDDFNTNLHLMISFFLLNNLKNK